MKRRRKFHPVNMIRYVGWNPKRLLADWQTIEQYLATCALCVVFMHVSVCHTRPRVCREHVRVRVRCA